MKHSCAGFESDSVATAVVGSAVGGVCAAVFDVERLIWKKVEFEDDPDSHSISSAVLLKSENRHFVTLIGTTNNGAAVFQEGFLAYF